jgi:hypothetical protein
MRVYSVQHNEPLFSHNSIRNRSAHIVNIHSVFTQKHITHTHTHRFTHTVARTHKSNIRAMEIMKTKRTETRGWTFVFERTIKIPC